MIDLWPLWVYLFGYAGFWRYHVGFMLADFMGSSRNVDGSDIAFALTLGSVFALFWPVTVPARVAYRVLLAHIPSGDALRAAFPPPKPVETPADRVRRLEREAQDQQREADRMRAKITALEHELDIRDPTERAIERLDNELQPRRFWRNR